MTDKGEREVRVASQCFSDNIGLSIPVKYNPDSHPDEFYTPLVAFLHAISLFSYKALSKGILMRGAIAYGEIYQTSTVIVGEPFIEAVSHEKTANYPRIIVASSAKNEIQKFSQRYPYGWDLEKINERINFKRDEIDGTVFFDWLNFHRFQPEDNSVSSKQLEIDNTIISAKKIMQGRIKEETDISVLQKLFWIVRYFEKLTTP
ncbi:Uncharacterised protein [Legionella spiritensis]|nr:Uncharacterised protein [Legionella spiritensis]